MAGRQAVSGAEQKEAGAPLALVAGMGGCYALGTFTDNFYKQAAVLLAADMQLTWVQSAATVFYSLPFILFSAWAGWLADRLAKKRIVVAAKLTELAAMILGGFFLAQGMWWGILGVLFCMGLQATAFSPALNGSIPEVFPESKVPRVNSLIKLASTLAVLLGVAAAGIFLDLRPGGLLPPWGEADGPAYGRRVTAVFLFLMALAGVGAALTLRRRPPALGGGRRPFPWSGPVDSLRHFWECRRDEQLFLVLLAEAYFYGVAAMAVISVANLAAAQGGSQTSASLLSAMLMIGVAAGSLPAGRLPADGWKRSLFPAAAGMGFFLLLAALAPLLPKGEGLCSPQICWLGAALFLSGVCGGVYLIPLVSFIQVRPHPAEKGKVLGVSNFASFVSIAVWGCAFGLVGLLPPAWTFVVYGLATMLFAFLVAGRRIRRLAGASLKDASAGPVGCVLRLMLSLRYQVREKGLDAIAGQGKGEKGILFLPNHPALIDPLIVYSRLAGLRPRPLADQGQMAGLAQRLAGRLVRAILLPDVRRAGRESAGQAREALASVIESLRCGDNVLLYPSGRVYRSEREELGGNAAVAVILESLPDIRVVLLRSRGLWGSSFSYADGTAPRFMPRLLAGALTLALNGILFSPRRQVTLEWTEPADLPRDGDKMRLNRYLETFYQEVQEPAIGVPRYFWQGSEPFWPFSPASPAASVPPAVSPRAREAVLGLLREAAGLSPDQPLRPEQALGADLGLDSLAVADLASALEAEFGHPLPSLERLNTVGDCLLAAEGKLGGPAAAGKIPPSWFAPDTDAAGAAALFLPQGASSLPECFLRHVRAHPDLPLLADRSGSRSRSEVLTAALALAGRLSSFAEQRLGMMLPASPAAAIVWLAILLAGKEPVLLNWTTGRRNLLHCLETAGVRRAVTAADLLGQMERQGAGLGDLPVEWLKLEHLAQSLTRGAKALAYLRVRLFCLGLPAVSAAGVPATAAILFTSGSEAAPKGVPLTQANIMANAADIVAMLSISVRDRVLSMLPPFHSFGLMVGVVLPLAAGLAAACHPNPTESASLNRLIRDFRLTLLGATPSFLAGMLARAGEGETPASLRLAFVGAEKCPEHVYSSFAGRYPGASLCEGYGITECSPVVAVNPPGNAVPGSVGLPLPSLHIAIVREERARDGALCLVRLGAGEEGVLLVRGPSVFSGYLGAAPDPFVLFEGERWYHTGDLAVCDELGRLTFKGRLKRFAKVGGEMISLPQMEAVLQAALAGRISPDGEGRPCLAVEVSPGSEESGHPEIIAFSVPPFSAQELNAALRESGLSPLHSVHRVIAVEEIPLLGAGKIDYQALRRRV
ncbi:MAG: MFS transporter [Desulfovibrio sp.]|jgi:acyl-CoA synthetase (AMP-forming)/AMP-acid ligase II/MFS family permease/acyl carrier protein|nr:MFS transporter [Desulfovibrio sp.]